MKIKNVLIPSLIDEVIGKYVDSVNELDGYRQLDALKHTKLLSRFGANLFSDETHKVKQKFQNLIEFYKDSGIECKDIFDNLAIFFELYGKWVKKHNVAGDEYIAMLEDMYAEQLQKFSMECQSGDEDQADDFLFLEDVGVDEVIDGMHYEDAKKISAEEFLEQNPLDADAITDIVDVKQRLEDLLNDYYEYSDEFKQEFITSLSKILTTLEYIFTTKEFSDISLALNKLVDTLNNIEIQDPQMEELAYTTLVSFIEDLIKWLDELFIEQSAVDIHYLDASFYANISQFEMIFQGSDQTASLETEDDDFLF